MSFANKVVIITGAGSGIGEAIAVQFAKLSATLSLIDKNENNLHKVARKCEVFSKEKVIEVTADISNEVELKQAVERTVKELGKIDVVINCAGIFRDGGILDSDLLRSFDEVMNVNLRSTIAMTHYTSPELIKSKGCVVNMASGMANMAYKGVIPYNVSKAAVLCFTRNVALELADKGVRVNSISPGAVETDILINAGKSHEENGKWWLAYSKFTPLQHNIQPSEIADMAVYLASDKARSITGADFLIDSGMTMAGVPTEEK